MLIKEDDIATLGIKMIEAFEKSGLKPKLNKKKLSSAIEMLEFYKIEEIDFGIIKGFSKLDNHLYIKINKISI